MRTESQVFWKTYIIYISPTEKFLLTGEDGDNFFFKYDSQLRISQKGWPIPEILNTEKKEICDELIPESLTMLINYGVLSLLTV